MQFLEEMPCACTERNPGNSHLCLPYFSIRIPMSNCVSNWTDVQKDSLPHIFHCGNDGG